MKLLSCILSKHIIRSMCTWNNHNFSYNFIYCEHLRQILIIRNDSVSLNFDNNRLEQLPSGNDCMIYIFEMTLWTLLSAIQTFGCEASEETKFQTGCKKMFNMSSNYFHINSRKKIVKTFKLTNLPHTYWIMCHEISCKTGPRNFGCPP